MPRSPASISHRLLLGAGVFIAAALLVAALIISLLLQRFITGQIDGRLDTQLVVLSSMVHATPDGTITLAGNADGPPFDGPRPGWYWEVLGPRNQILSHALDGRSFAVPAFRPPPRDNHPAPADGAGPDGQLLHYRIQPLAVGGVPVVLIATAPREAIADPLHDAMRTLAASLIVLAGALIAAMFLQVRLGLRPLVRLRDAVALIRTGRSERVPEAQPLEIQPLVTELNALLAQNTANLERARNHVANLAHGLKTPLATLAIALADASRDRNGELRAQVALIERRIRHHLGRARSAALCGPVRARTPIDRLGDLAEVLEKIYRDRAIKVTQTLTASLAVACEQQDFDEMAGNLLDNAFKWTRSRIAIRAAPALGHSLEIAIADDGPGIDAAQLPLLLKPGTRADESAPGFGFGLSITRELAELYGGTLKFTTSEWGGLEAILRLPLGG